MSHSFVVLFGVVRGVSFLLLGATVSCVSLRGVAYVVNSLGCWADKLWGCMKYQIEHHSVAIVRYSRKIGTAKFENR